MKNVEPILKWAGGKRWLAKNYSWLFPGDYERLVEPFVGGAAVFLALRPPAAILSDLNEDLISLYSAIRDDWKGVSESLQDLADQHSDEFYYEVRKRSETDNVKGAARFLYLNRTCWNGLYRVNLKGEFNVPRGTKNAVMLPTDNFAELSRILETATLSACDFATTLQKSGSGDFVFLDPPYTVAHNNNGFLKYNEQIFSWKDQIRLRDEAVAAAARGACVLILNAHHTSVVDLYTEFGTLHRIPRHSVISGASAARKPIEELAIQLGYQTQAAILEKERVSPPQAVIN